MENDRAYYLLPTLLYVPTYLPNSKPTYTTYYPKGGLSWDLEVTVSHFISTNISTSD